MKKLVSIIALMAMLVIVSSGADDKEMFLSEGDRVPELSLTNATRSINLDDMQGGYVLLTFWSSADARSRVECSKYSNWFAKNDRGNVKHVSVNLDIEPVLFEEMVKLDNLDADAQFNLTGDAAARVISDFNLQEGLGSILISPDGEVAMFNPTTHDLSSL